MEKTLAHPVADGSIGWRSDFTVGAKCQLKRDHDKRYTNGTITETNISFRKTLSQVVRKHLTGGFLCAVLDLS